jgi:hypothetical protein
MAKAAEPATADRGEEYVDFMIPRSSPEDRPVVIGVNGEFIRVLPGEQVTVRRKFVEAWMNSQAQRREAWKTQSNAQAASKKALAEL